MGQDLTSIVDVHDLEQTALEAQSIPLTSYEIIKESAQKYRSDLAIEFFMDANKLDEVEQISYESLYEQVTKAGNMLRDHGVGRGDVVAYLLPNLPETHYVIWGGEAAGIILGLNPMLEADQLATLMRTAKTKWLVCLGPTPGVDIWEKAIEAVPDIPTIKGIFQVNLSEHMSGPKSWALETLAVYSRFKAAMKLGMPVKNFTATLRHYRGDKLDFEEPNGDDLASYFCTGGTTGLPKIAKRRHSSEAFNAWSMSKTFEGSMFPGGGVFCGLPLFHVNGVIVTGLIPWATGARVVMGTPLGYRGKGVIKNFWKIIEKFRLEAFSAVPTIFAALLDEPHEGYDLSCLQVAICGSAPLPKEVYRKFLAATNVPIAEGYGLTETTCVSSFNPGLSEDSIGSIGIRLPYQKMKTVILDDDGNFVRDAEIDEVGVIAVNGPNVFDGYFDPSQNKDVWIYRDGEKWLNTGDLARVDEKGYFWLTGRKKELIIRSGHNIDPKTIEEVLHAHPKVKLAAAIGRPDKYAGELPVAYVELVDGADASGDELIEYAKQGLSERASWPKAIEIISDMPVTPVGKIFKPSLTMMEIQRTIEQEAEALQCDIDKVMVEQDKRLGLVAKVEGVSSEVDKEKLAQGLGQFCFNYQIV